MIFRRSHAWLLLALLASITLFAGWLLKKRIERRPAPDSQQRFAHWRAAHQAEVARYFSFLKSQGVDGVLPPEQLLRLGRRWPTCGGEEFGLPPAELWPEMVPSLHLLAELKRQGLLAGAVATSGYRPAAYNRCEGGSRASRHLTNQAIDLDVSRQSAVQVSRLCSAWRQLGPARKWGLGFYSAHRVHLDTAGFRTWGYDFHGPSSLCVMPGANQ